MQRKSSTSLKTIETKLDALMTSLNNFMTEMKSKKDSTSPSLTPIDSIDSSDNSRESKMTIAVNTDPLGLLALFRISSEAIKQLMSYVDYNWYFSRLPPPGGKKWGLGLRLQHLDCCVCRHALDTKRCCSSLFGCQYCGQVFTRAYCCELHQQTCARRFGRKHDVSSSLVMLS
ncbi:hypothetical protein MSG28_009003 [Choristoneura fumiferana]|uniref:Uncharacterized protein n=1 Tax=Choristoneura fumiferana TaxID=7141 RepID=A0ACC0J8X9_CHOFU|nr:hypothetical protein MSG28_009003 [Choristoneura fumiferana]